MANKKDLSEAQSYSRRRLVTAFASGIPNGVELSPKKNQTPVIVGIGLTIIAIIIGTFYGYLRPSLPQDWENNKLIVAKSSAARYVSENGTLHPVINAVSARLMIPASDFDVITVDDDQLTGIPITSTLGILGAPDSLPEQSKLIAGTLSSCAQSGNITNILSVQSQNGGDSRSAVVAHVEDADYLITGSTRYRLPSDRSLRDGFLRAFDIPQTAIIQAPIQWLNLFQRGTDIEPIHLDTEQTTQTTHGVEAGTIITRQGDPAQTKYVVMTDGSISQLDDFTYNVYTVGKNDVQTSPITLSATEFQRFSNATTSPLPQDWPTSTLTSVSTQHTMCAVLPLTGDNSQVQFVAKNTDSNNSPTTSQTQRIQTTLEGGSGALLRASIGSTDVGTVFAVDSTGTAYPIPDATEEILNRLGYQTQDVHNVPRAWVDIFPTGVELTPEAAGTAPSQKETANE